MAKGLEIRLPTNLTQVPTRNHNDLQNRDAADAHPEASITKTTYADATLSGTPIIIKVDIGGTPYYFKAYPTKV